jgi:Probable cobalt transporter subunit (CbtA)
VVRALLVKGLLVGVLAGLLAAAFAWVFGEPQVNLAIAFEAHARQLAGDAPEPVLVSRAIQSTVGLLVGILVYASALGGIFALVFAAAYGRTGGLSARATAAIIAAAGFVTLILVPQIKYPANPPAIGDPATIGPRTALYFMMLAISIMSAFAALSTGRQLARRFGAWNGAVAAGLLYLAAIAVGMLVLPAVDEVPGDFSATLLWRFRLASLGIEAVLWATLGLVFGAVVERQFSPAVRTGRAAVADDPLDAG